MFGSILPMGLTLGVVFGLLVLAEILRSKNKIHGELARKFVHVCVGSFVATWPWYLQNNEIYVLCGLFAIGVVVSRYANIFKSIHGVKRDSWGDLMFPVGIAATAFLATEQWIFSAAILHLSIADAAAAVVGQTVKKPKNYKVFGRNKSVVGTMTFWIISLLITSAFVILQPGLVIAQTATVIVWLSVIVTFVENVSPSGADNVLVPTIAALILNSMIV
ncbi:MAG: hypothetical protein M3P98_00330 [bacterium]|nr:hypothetical protein [bacterium]